ncbi:MAG TPA: hypothetical protein VKV04_07305 [Verrucomicrobiae bacterium]|nr:hypothetical protein [Verrucomicrobiae bacterium]
MKKKNRIDPELEAQIKGLSAKQIRLLASIYVGLAEALRKETTESMTKWKDRNEHIWN